MSPVVNSTYSGQQVFLPLLANVFKCLFFLGKKRYELTNRQVGERVIKNLLNSNLKRRVHSRQGFHVVDAVLVSMF
jgi:hypothetical protein